MSKEKLIEVLESRFLNEKEFEELETNNTVVEIQFNGLSGLFYNYYYYTVLLLNNDNIEEYDIYIK